MFAYEFSTKIQIDTSRVSATVLIALQAFTKCLEHLSSIPKENADFQALRGLMPILLHTDLGGVLLLYFHTNL